VARRKLVWLGIIVVLLVGAFYVRLAMAPTTVVLGPEEPGIQVWPTRNASLLKDTGVPDYPHSKHYASDPPAAFWRKALPVASISQTLYLETNDGFPKVQSWIASALPTWKVESGTSAPGVESLTAYGTDGRTTLQVIEDGATKHCHLVLYRGPGSHAINSVVSGKAPPANAFTLTLLGQRMALVPTSDLSLLTTAGMPDYPGSKHYAREGVKAAAPSQSGPMFALGEFAPLVLVTEDSLETVQKWVATTLPSWKMTTVPSEVGGVAQNGVSANGNVRLRVGEERGANLRYLVLTAGS
jgi:hypothetical protein